MSNIFTLTSLPFTETLKGTILFKYFKVVVFRNYLYTKKRVTDSRRRKFEVVLQIK